MSELKTGTIIGCEFLKVFDSPESDAEEICELAKTATVMIDEAESTEEYVNICTAAGIEGYCRRENVSIEP